MLLIPRLLKSSSAKRPADDESLPVCPLPAFPDPFAMTASAPSSVTTTSTETTSFPLRVFFGHHKCATGWTGGTLREIALHLGRTFRVVNQTKDFAAEGSLGDFVKTNGVEVLSYANAKIKHARSLPLYRGFHVVRDPRDVLVSGYFSHRKTHGTNNWPELVEHRARLQSMSKSDGLFAEMEFSARFFEEMRTWDYEQPNVLELRMEDITADPIPHFLHIARFLNVLDEDEHVDTNPVHRFAQRLAPLSNRWNHRGRRFMPGRLPMFPTPKTRLDYLPEDVIVDIVERRTFEKLTGRKKGQENRNTHLRKGVPGDWINHFTTAHIREFKDRYNDLLLKLRYVDTPDW